MRIAVAREVDPAEPRVAATPDTVKKLTALGAEVTVQAGAGVKSGVLDTDYTAAGATVSANAIDGADIVLKVRRPGQAEVAGYKKGALVIAIMDPFGNEAALGTLAKAGVTAFAMELMPRITRAQAMDVLSSQANLAGYRAVIDGAADYGRALPMMITAAGTVPATKVFVMGAGVAGLQAIATARRLGAVVEAFDVRPAVKEEVQSLGATFVDMQIGDAGVGAGGYAREMDEQKNEQIRQTIAGRLPNVDVVISTASIPGKRAPLLLPAASVALMKPGSVIVDLAAESGGNCALTQAGTTIVDHNVTIHGPLDLAATLAKDASQMYSRNLYELIVHLAKDARLSVDFSDEITRGCCLTYEGRAATDLATAGKVA